MGDFYTVLRNAKERAACAEVASAEVHRILCPQGTWNLSQSCLRQDTHVEILPPIQVPSKDNFLPGAALSKHLFCFVNCTVELLKAWPETPELFALKI